MRGDFLEGGRQHAAASARELRQKGQAPLKGRWFRGRNRSLTEGIVVCPCTHERHGVVLLLEAAEVIAGRGCLLGGRSAMLLVSKVDPPLERFPGRGARQRTGFQIL